MIKKLIQTLDSLKLLYFTVNYVVESSTYNVTQFIKLKLQITGKLNFSNIRTYGLECNFPKLEWWSDKTVRPITVFEYSINNRRNHSRMTIVSFELFSRIF